MNIEEERVVSNLKECLMKGTDREFLFKVRGIVQREIRRQRNLEIKEIKQKVDLLADQSEEGDST